MDLLAVKHFPILHGVLPEALVISMLVQHPLVYHVRQWTDATNLYVLVEAKSDGRFYVLRFVHPPQRTGWTLTNVGLWHQP